MRFKLESNLLLLLTKLSKKGKSRIYLYVSPHLIMYLNYKYAYNRE